MITESLQDKWHDTKYRHSWNGERKQLKNERGSGTNERTMQEANDIVRSKIVSVRESENICPYRAPR